MRTVSLRTRLLAALAGVGLLTVLATGWQANRRGEASLRQAVINQLTSIRGERQREIENHFAGVRVDALTLAESRDVTGAMRAFRAAYRELESSVAAWPPERRRRYRADVERYYRTAFAPRLLALEAVS